MRDGARQGVHGHGRQLRVGHPGHRGHRGRAAQLLADGAGVDEAQPQPRRARPHRADPAVAGPHRPRRPERRQTAGVGRGFDVDGAPVARQPAPAQRPAAQRGRDRLPAGAHPARARPPGAVGGSSTTTTTPSATRSPRSCPAATTTTRKVRAARRLPAAAPAPRLARIPHQHRQSQLRGRTRWSGCRCPRAG